jgi:hypothetical protein
MGDNGYVMGVDKIPVASTRRLSWSSFESGKRPIKYGAGRYRNVELVPQPSDDPEDPLVSRRSYTLDGGFEITTNTNPTELASVEEGG